jgi:hypothetical protein
LKINAVRTAEGEVAGAPVNRCRISCPAATPARATVDSIILPTMPARDSAFDSTNGSGSSTVVIAEVDDIGDGIAAPVTLALSLGKSDNK